MSRAGCSTRPGWRRFSPPPRFRVAPRYHRRSRVRTNSSRSSDGDSERQQIRVPFFFLSTQVRPAAAKSTPQLGPKSCRTEHHNATNAGSYPSRRPGCGCCWLGSATAGSRVACCVVWRQDPFRALGWEPPPPPPAPPKSTNTKCSERAHRISNLGEGGLMGKAGVVFFGTRKIGRLEKMGESGPVE